MLSTIVDKEHEKIQSLATGMVAWTTICRRKNSVNMIYGMWSSDKVGGTAIDEKITHSARER